MRHTPRYLMTDPEQVERLVRDHPWATFGTPEVLAAEENDAVRCRLTDHVERDRPDGRSLLQDEAATRRAARGTTGLRLRVDRFEARAELSQNEPADVVATIAGHLAEHDPALADGMHQAAQRGDGDR